ncbi:MAG: alpha-2,3-sialyltransferase [Brevinema sp.]
MKPIVVAGNGPSLTAIDYCRLPKEFDVFRVNNFFFEDYYWVGKHVTGYFVPHFEQLEIQFYHIQELKQRNEYYISKVYCLGSGDPTNFPTVDFIPFTYSHMPEINEYIHFYQYYYHQTMTSGIRMLLEAIAQGYTEIYLVGIDLYTGTQMYAFKINQNMCDLHPDRATLKDSIAGGLEARRNLQPWHSGEYDASIIKMISNLDGVSVYSLSEDSPINDIIPLAPHCNETPHTPIPKPNGSINDWIKNPLIIRQERLEQEKLEQERLEQERLEQEKLEQERLEQERLEQEKLEQERLEQERLEQERLEQERLESQRGVIRRIKKKFIDKGMESEWNSLRENIYLRLVYHVIKPIWVCLKFILKS